MSDNTTPFKPYMPPAPLPTAPVAPAPVVPQVPQVDTKALRDKVTSGKPLTAEEIASIKKLTSDEVTAVHTPEASAKSDLSTMPKDLWDRTTAAKPVPIVESKKGMNSILATGMNEKIPMNPGTDYSKQPQAIPMAQIPTQPIASQGPTPFSGAVRRENVGAGKALDQPVDIKKASDVMANFMANAPEGATLANILDAVGVALSAKGGINRKTMLSQRNEAQLATQQQLKLQAQQIEAMKNQKTQEYQQAEAMGDHARAAQLINDLKIIEAQKNAAIEQGRALSAQSSLKSGGGVGGIANKYLETVK